MHDTMVPTVKIADPFKDGDYRIINEADFDAKVHRRWSEAEEAKAVPVPVVHAVSIPDYWREMRYFALRALASNFTDGTIDGKEQAASVIEAELARRG